MLRMTPLVFFCTTLLVSQLVSFAEDLTGERSLPVHAERDAYTPAATFLKDSYLVVWQSGRLAPGDLREGLKFWGDIVGCRVDRSGNPLDATPIVICKAEDLQERPRVASNKNVALVVWHDIRNGKDWDVYAARVASDGKVLDPDGILVSGGPHNQANPRVTWDGKTFVVVWQDLRDGKSYQILRGIAKKYEVYAARISEDGKVLDPQGIKLSSEDGSCYDPDVSSSGDGQSVVIWVGEKGRCALLADGKVEKNIEPDDLDLKNPAQRGNGRCYVGRGAANTPAFLAVGKDNYLMAWRNDHPCGRGNGSIEANAWLFGKNGPQKALPTLSGQNHQILGADLCWDGAAFVAACTESQSGGKWIHRGPNQIEGISVSRVSSDGKVLTYQYVTGGKSVPATNACVATDGAGTTLIAYEKQHATPEKPIEIGFRLLTTK